MNPIPIIKPPTVPASVLEKLRDRRGEYTDMVTVFHCLCFGQDCWMGVAGDGDNGSYEWFVSTPETFKTSDAGWGSTITCLREVLQMNPDYC